MPVVPFTTRTAQSQPIPKIDPTFLMMAAAELHEAGRLIDPKPDGHVDITRQNNPPDVLTDDPDFDRQNDEYFTGKAIDEANNEVKLPPEQE